MGFFDRFSSKKPVSAAPSAPAPAAEPAAPERTAAAGGIMPRLQEARLKLEAKDLPGALAIYEDVLATAGDRADVLVTMSGDLGVNGHLQQIIELVAPRYDADRHGPATGLNLLQAYLASRNVDAAQHLLDILFALNRPELEDRLLGFSNALAELIASEHTVAETPVREAGKIALVTISKPIWFYGLETFAPHLLPPAEGRPRRVAFAQCAVPGLADWQERAAKPEDELGRLSRGLALWFAETFAASAGYAPVAAVGTQDDHYALFPVEWTAENIRQITDSAEGGLDFVVTSALKNRNDDFELTLRIWEVKKFRELKAFSTRWTPATADAALAQFHAQVRGYMEWTARPAGQGLAYAPPAAPLAYLYALGAELSFFLGEKGVIGPDHTPRGTAALLRAAQVNPEDARAQLALVAALLRLKAQGRDFEPESLQHAQAWLASPAAQAADASALAVKLA